MDHSSLADQAYNLIKQAIITCEIMPGDQIAQSHLVEKMGLGISSVRAALQRLTQEGFVKPISRFGYLVSPVTMSNIQDLFELRNVLEVAAVRLAAERGSDETILNISKEANFTYTYQNRESYIAFLDRNNEFHLKIAQLSRNERLVEAVSKVLGELTRVFHLGLDLRDSGEEMRDEHIQLVNALTVRDVDMASRLVYKQILRSQERIVDSLAQRLQNDRNIALTSKIPF
jgi:DNA-binding GntR family transcriptional regulator